MTDELNKAIESTRNSLKSFEPSADWAVQTLLNHVQLYENALQYLMDFTGSKPIGSTEYQIHMYIYSTFVCAENGEFND